MSEVEEVGASEPVRKSRAARPRATVANTPEEFINPETGEPYRRRAGIHAIGAGIFEIPAKYRKAKWDYQWAPLRVFNEPVDASEHANLRDGGWTPVAASEMPDLCPPGWDKKTIERGNQILYKRPMFLTLEAKSELKSKADQQMEDKFAAAQMTPAGTAPRHLKTVRNNHEPLPDDLRRQYEGEVEEV